MSTFRNNQIEEILNNERNMNRVILDRVSAHIASIGDDKAPPTTRDIKIEAQIGGLIDALKETINKAIQKISGYQYGRATEKNTARNLKLKTNEMGTQTGDIPGVGTQTEEGPDVDDDDDDDDEEKELVEEMKKIANSSGDIA
jgi:hypothetical protein